MRMTSRGDLAGATVRSVRDEHAPLVAVIGNHPPRRCGIATFTQDLRDALAGPGAGLRCLTVAMSDGLGPYAYPTGSVDLDVPQDDAAAYRRAGAALDRAGVRAVCLQHEFGIFGGPAGAHVLELLRATTAPVVTTLHTVLEHPDADQRRVMAQLVDRSDTLVVMARKGASLLADRYGVPPERIAVVPHGIPDAPLRPVGAAKRRLGLSDRPVLLTFGLLSPNKGIEVMLDALPEIVREAPDILYLVVGATHPNLRRAEGERYRLSLTERARALGVAGNLELVDRFVALPELLDYIAAADVYVTPYLNEAQITSGTLAYAMGLGKPVVSSPYWYARELLAHGRGELVPFGDAPGFAGAINALLSDAARRAAVEDRALRAGAAMRWSAVGRRYAALLLREAGHAMPASRSGGSPALPPAAFASWSSAGRAA